MSATVSTAVDAAAPQVLPKARKRKRRRYGKSPKSCPVKVERFMEDDIERVRVSLFGRGFGQHMVLDAADWDDGLGKKGWPECWVLCGNGKGLDYVKSSQRRVGSQATQQSGVPKATLARLIVGAMPGEAVIYRDGNHLNLRRSNLLKLDREAAGRWRSERLTTACNRL